MQVILQPIAVGIVLMHILYSLQNIMVKANYYKLIITNYTENTSLILLS